MGSSITIHDFFWQDNRSWKNPLFLFFDTFLPFPSNADPLYKLNNVVLSVLTGLLFFVFFSSSVFFWSFRLCRFLFLVVLFSVFWAFYRVLSFCRFVTVLLVCLCVCLFVFLLYFFFASLSGCLCVWVCECTCLCVDMGSGGKGRIKVVLKWWY